MKLYLTSILHKGGTFQPTLMNEGMALFILQCLYVWDVFLKASIKRTSDNNLLNVLTFASDGGQWDSNIF